ncbi:MAG: hypothetical protein ACOX6T_00650 [Myxococcales bacterium]|jgi:hypothetical protein
MRRALLCPLALLAATLSGCVLVYDVDDLAPEEGMREPRPEPELAALGEACRSSPECESGQCNTSFPDGYCTQSCLADAQCPGLGPCHISGATGMCLARCGQGSECRSGYHCAVLLTSPQRGCLPAESEEACPIGCTHSPKGCVTPGDVPCDESCCYGGYQ